MTTSAARRPAGTAPADPREALRGLIPDLRAFARTLDPDPDKADALVRNALAEMLTDWPAAVSAEALEALIEARAAAPPALGRRT